VREPRCCICRVRRRRRVLTLGWDHEGLQSRARLRVCNPCFRSLAEVAFLAGPIEVFAQGSLWENAPSYADVFPPAPADARV
jgi:hypothetical protein